MLLRPESESDYPAIRAILLAAFADHPYSRQTEHLIVEALRAAGAVTLALVAEVEGRVVGQIAFSPVWIDGQDRGWFGLGPVAVAPECQRRGIGSALVEAGVAALRDRGARGCVLVGDPAFYQRFGFRAYPALVMEGVPAENVLALPLAVDVPAGAVTHHPAFFVGL